MRPWRGLLVGAMAAGLALLAACTPSGSSDTTPSPSASSPGSVAPTPSAATTGTTAVAPTPTGSTSRPSPSASSPSAGTASPSRQLPSGFSLKAKEGGTAPARASLLRTIRTGRHDGYDRVVFEFIGPAPAYQVRYVAEVTEDPSGQPVTLEGDAFLLVVMPGGTLDTTPQVSDPSDAEKYEGPRRIRPSLANVREIAASGDFEAVLSFGIGVEHRDLFRVLRLSNPSRIVVDVATATAQ